MCIVNSTSFFLELVSKFGNIWCAAVTLNVRLLAHLPECMPNQTSWNLVLSRHVQDCSVYLFLKMNNIFRIWCFILPLDASLPFILNYASLKDISDSSIVGEPCHCLIHCFKAPFKDSPFKA